jgi:hypothetical protein
MSGFLDPNAPSIEAEYPRYINGDIRGKILFKNFLLHRIGISPENIYIPLGRYVSWGAQNRPRKGA